MGGKGSGEKSCRVRETDYHGGFAVTVYMKLSRFFFFFFFLKILE